MAKVSKLRTDKQIQYLKGNPELPYPVSYSVRSDASGLYIQVSPSGNKSWIFRYTEPGTGRINPSTGSRIPQNRREIGLGSYGKSPLNISLENARILAIELRQKIRQGIDPIEERKQQKSLILAQKQRSITFEEAALKWLDVKAKEWKSPKDYPLVKSRFGRFVFPSIGAMRLSDIETSHIVETLKPIWIKVSDSAMKLRGNIHNVFVWAIAENYIDGPNPTPTKQHMDVSAGNSAKIIQKKNHPALPYSEMPKFMEKLKDYGRTPALALRFTILTACRTAEVVESTWDEFDLDGKMWVIPAERMKANREHRVPLSKAAVKIIEKLPRVEGNPHVFVGQKKGRPLSKDNGMLTFLKLGLGRKDLTVHGMRSCFCDWANESTGHPHEVIEMALAHTIKNKAEAAYRRGDLLQKRRSLMDDWSAYCMGDK